MSLVTLGPIKPTSIVIPVLQITIWDLEVTVYIQDPDTGEQRLASQGECSVWVDDVDELTGQIAYTTSPAALTDANGIAVIPDFCGGMWDPFGNVVGNRYRVNAEHLPTGGIARDNNLWVSNEGCEPPKDLSIYVDMQRRRLHPNWTRR